MRDRVWGLRWGVALAVLGGLLPATAQAAPRVHLVTVGRFVSPVRVTAPPQDPRRVFVVERAGRIRELVGGKVRTFADLRSLVKCCEGERGLLGLAFAPDYAATGLLYVYLTGRPPATRATGNIVIGQLHADTPDHASADTFKAVLEIPHDQQDDHDGGGLAFGPDGYLYAGTGDGGAGGDKAHNGQNLTSTSPAVVNYVNHSPLLAKLLRIAPRADGGYDIPDTNPFPAPAREVFAYGLRNPFRFSFDRDTGDLAIGDVGQAAYEEVDFAPGLRHGRGADYGWNRFEGLHTWPGGTPATSATGFTFPVIEKRHDPDGWCAITGGVVVRDPHLPALRGRYLYSDYCRGDLYAATLRPGHAVRDHRLAFHFDRPVDIGEDACGRVYVVSLGGSVRRLSQSGACEPPTG